MPHVADEGSLALAAAAVDSPSPPSAVQKCTARYPARVPKRRSEIDWDDLRFLREALRAGSLAGAARALGVEHTTIGRRLTALEKALGVALVVRGSDGLHPTPTALAIAPLLDDLDRSVGGVRDLARTRRSHVRLATPSGFAAYFTRAIAELRERRPDISLDLVSGARPVDLQRGEADLALRIGPIDDPSLVVRRLGEAGWALYASRRYRARNDRPIDPEDLSGHEVIGYDAAMAKSPPAQWLAAHAGSAAIVMHIREMVDMRDAAVNGVGLAVLPCGLGDPHPELDRATARNVASRPISLVYRRDARLSNAVRVVARLAVEVMTEHAAELAGSRV